MKAYLFLIIFVCFVSCNLADKSSVEYCNKLIVDQNANPASLILQNYLDEFYFGNGYYPNSLQEFYDVGEWEDWHIETFNFFTLRDPYLPNDGIADSVLHYYPIYDRNSELPVSFVLLSAGEDRVINSNVAEKLYTDNWEKQIKAYNKKTVIDDDRRLIYVAYPTFSKRFQRFIHDIVGFDKATFDSKQVTLYGDTLFDSVYRYSLFDINDTDGRTFYYSEYSRYRAMFGKKDYIVAYGREFIKYEIVTE